MPYREAWDLQRAFHRGRASGRAADDYLLLLEHPPTFTLGTGGDAAHVLTAPGELARLGAEVLRVDRGGDVTFHGPGQLVGYPIVHLGERPDVVTLGGVDTAEVSSSTMESKRVPGLHFVGEVLDVTGWLGGYNFQWAWASGHAAGGVV
jgi:hypothetical protein